CTQSAPMSFKISTWNVKGSNSVVKKKSILNSLKKDSIHIAFLQETHLTDDEHKKYCREWVGQVFYSSYATNKRGVITLIHKNLPLTVISTHKDKEGRYIFVKGVLHGENVLLGNVYAPNLQDDEFYAELLGALVDMECGNVILAGDFNCVLCPELDRLPPHSVLTKNSKALLQILSELNLVDVWRHYNPLVKHFTFHSNPHLSASRIDYIFISKNICQLAEQVNIGPIGLSDHAPVSLSMKPLRAIERSRSWRMSMMSLLDDKFINFITEQTTVFLECNDTEEIDPRILWDCYKAYMRGMILSYTAHKKKERLTKQLELEGNLKKLEIQYYKTQASETLSELKHARAALNNLITHKAEKDILFANKDFLNPLTNLIVFWLVLLKMLHQILL
uniref:exodeoxyribonuclease III n=1 Tax=Neogobius melanostomus TaxID=47308 RepID=A0A8C6S5T9_9GOBI